jgi:hypothetical protein
MHSTLTSRRGGTGCLHTSTSGTQPVRTPAALRQSPRCHLDRFQGDLLVGGVGGFQEVVQVTLQHLLIEARSRRVGGCLPDGHFQRVDISVAELGKIGALRTGEAPTVLQAQPNEKRCPTVGQVDNVGLRPARASAQTSGVQQPTLAVSRIWDRIRRLVRQAFRCGVPPR